MDNAILAEAVRAEFNRLGLLPAQQAHVSGRMADIIHGPRSSAPRRPIALMPLNAVVRRERRLS